MQHNNKRKEKKYTSAFFALYGFFTWNSFSVLSYFFWVSCTGTGHSKVFSVAPVQILLPASPSLNIKPIYCGIFNLSYNVQLSPQYKVCCQRVMILWTKRWGEMVTKTKSFGEFVLSTNQQQPQAEKEWSTSSTLTLLFLSPYVKYMLAQTCRPGHLRGKDDLSLPSL